MWKDVRGKKHLEVLVTRSRFSETLEDAIVSGAERFTVGCFVTHVNFIDALSFFIKSADESESPYDYAFIYRPSDTDILDSDIAKTMCYIDDSEIPTKIVITSDRILGSDIIDRFKKYDCFAGSIDVSWSGEYTKNILIDSIESVLCSDTLCLERYRTELIDVLTKMNRIMPVQFVDTDCDNGVYNFGEVTLSPEDNRVYVELMMWNDDLPAHKDEPLYNGRGRKILPSPQACCETCKKNINCEKCEGYDKFELSDNQFKQYFENGRIGCPAYRRKENE